MTRTLTKQVFTFDELSDSAKEKARDWYRTDYPDHEWWDCVYDDFGQIAKILGFDIDLKEVFFTGFCSQGDGASFSGSYAYAKGAPKAIRAYAPQDKTLHALADRLQALQKPFFYQITGRISRSGYYYHEMTMTAEIERYDGRDMAQDAYQDAQEEFQDIARDLARWLYRTLETEFDYLRSDEAIDENMVINGYEFDEFGKPA
jgi:hypothetical protein